jgi:hypothetical protein
MPYLTTSQAEELLGVSTGTLQVWRQRFGFPERHGDNPDDPRFDRREIVLLRDALREGASVASAVRRAKKTLQVGSAPASGSADPPVRTKLATRTGR